MAQCRTLPFCKITVSLCAPVCCMSQYVWYMAAVRQIIFLKESYLDHTTPWRSSLPTYRPNFVKISASWAEICPQNKIGNGPSGGGILLSVSILSSILFRRPTLAWSQNFQENRSTRGWVTCNSTFSIATFNPTLPTAQRLGAIMPAIYKCYNKTR